MDEEKERQAGDPFEAAYRSEVDASSDAEDGESSRRAETIQRLGYLATRGATALVLVASGALTMRVVSMPPPAPIDAPVLDLSEAPPDIEMETRDYPELDTLLGNDRRNDRANSEVNKRVRRAKVKIAPRSVSAPIRSGGATRPSPVEPSAPAGHSPAPAAGEPKHVKETKEPRDKPKQPKPDPEPVPDRELFHVWKHGTADHVYYWEEWKTVDYYAPQEYYLYRDGNGSEGSLFSEQQEGTIPLRTDDGLVGYMYASGGEGRVPLYYLRGPTEKRRRDLFTSDATTRDAFLTNGWDDYGVVGYLKSPY